MFYIERKLKKRKNDLALIHLGPTFVVLIAFLGVTIWNSVEAGTALRISKQSAVESRIIETRDEISNRLTVYENIAKASVGLFGASDSVSRAEWKSFIDTIELTSRYPGVQSIGYIKVMKPSEVGAHLASMQAEGFSNYAISPGGVRDVYTAVQYIEPGTQSNKLAIGVDAYTEENRKTAMDIAMRTGETAITDPVEGIRDNKITTVTMYVPVFTKGTSPQDVQSRESSIAGFIFAGFKTDDLLINASTSTQDTNYGFTLYDKEQTEAPVLFTSDSYNRINSLNDKTAMTLSFFVANQEWTIAGAIDPQILPLRDRERPASSFWVGILFSVLVAGLIYMLLVNRTQNFRRRESIEIQRAKDELLALASHQLRTPATGVKQYIGMLREGYVGKLTQEQRKYINKAYASNERQINTINEMLVVAHADAGKMDLSIEKFDIAGMMREIIDEEETSFKEKNQDIQVQLPKRKVMIEADQRYLRMAVENVINNATKYTDDYGKIKISMYKSDKVVNIVVRDNGVGVDSNDFPLLFKKFSRIPNELTGKVTGTGIGLYLAQKIVKAHKGSIEFTSRLGRGSRCIISVPIKQRYDEM